jgi:hypothetical protein
MFSDVSGDNVFLKRVYLSAREAEAIPSRVTSLDLQNTRRHIPEYEQVRRHRHKALVWTVFSPWSNVALFMPVVDRLFKFIERPDILLLLSAERYENSVFVRDLST